MSLLTSTKNAKDEPKVHNSEYIKTANAPDAPVEKPAEPAKPEDKATE
jgi:hypothetical protein